MVDRKEESSVSNDVIEALLRRLSPRAREIYEEVVKLSERAAHEDTNPNELQHGPTPYSRVSLPPTAPTCERFSPSKLRIISIGGRRKYARGKKFSEPRRSFNVPKTSTEQKASPSATT
jgi:hypothetical protein